MIFDYDKCFCSGCQREVPRDRRCGPTLREQIDELRSRLQALEQNTVPPAKQRPREWWVTGFDNKGWDKAYKTKAEAMLPSDEIDEMAGPPHYMAVRVREVLDD